HFIHREFHAFNSWFCCAHGHWWAAHGGICPGLDRFFPVFRWQSGRLFPRSLAGQKPWELLLLHGAIRSYWRTAHADDSWQGDETGHSALAPRVYLAVRDEYQNNAQQRQEQDYHKYDEPIASHTLFVTQRSQSLKPARRQVAHQFGVGGRGSAELIA